MQVSALSLATLLACPPLLAQPDLAPPDQTDAPRHSFEQKGKFPDETRDSDGDGVPDIDDNCPNTPPDPTGKTKADNCGCPVPVIDPCSLDEDGDGVNDCLDKCPHTYKGHVVTFEGCPAPLAQSVRFRLDVKFAFDNARIQAGYAADLLKLRDILQRYPDISVSLEGHTDWTGTEGYNQRLSEKRANAARDFVLKGTEIATDRVKAAGYGESKPIASNHTYEGRAQNRRTVAEISFARRLVPANDQPPPLGDFAPETADVPKVPLEAPPAPADAAPPSTPDDEHHSGDSHQ